jgi:hypothetical protein
VLLVLERVEEDMVTFHTLFLRMWSEPDNFGLTATLMGTRPQFFDAFTDYTQSPSQWGSSASFGGTSFAQSGNSFLAPAAGHT